MGSSVGLFEGGFGLVVVVFEIKVFGSKLVLVSCIVVVLFLWLVVGVVGVVSLGFDMVVVFVKYCFCLVKWENFVVIGYVGSSFLFMGFFFSLGVVFGIVFVNVMVVCFVVFWLVIICFGGVVVVEFLGILFIGIGIVVGVLGFVGMLYVESLEDDFNEVFLKCSYWGNGECSEGKFVVFEEL